MQPPRWLAPLTVDWQITGGQSGTVEQEPLAFWTLLKLAVHSLVASLCCGLARMSLSLLLKAVGWEQAFLISEGKGWGARQSGWPFKEEGPTVDSVPLRASLSRNLLLYPSVPQPNFAGDSRRVVSLPLTPARHSR